MRELSPMEHADLIYNIYGEKRIDRVSAIARLQELLAVTEVGAADLLDNATPPTRRGFPSINR